MEAVFAPIAVADMPTVKVSKTFAVSDTVLLRYKASASESVNEVDFEKKSGFLLQKPNLIQF
jgi:hypothetical protein